MESDVPDNQAGGSGTEVGGQVLPFPGDWFGPVEELVPFGPRARVQANAAAAREDAAAPQASDPADGAREHDSAARPNLVAEDFWAGLADGGDLIQFPAEPVGGVSPSVRRRRPGRLVVAAATLAVVMIGLRAWNGAGADSGRAGAALAQTAVSNANATLGTMGVDQQTRDVPLRIRASAPMRPRTDPARILSRRVLVSQPRSSRPRSQPVVYSTPAPTQTATPSGSGAGSSSSGSGNSAGRGSGAGASGSGSGRSHDAGPRRAGPTGAAAAFGPGKMGG